MSSTLQARKAVRLAERLQGEQSVSLEPPSSPWLTASGAATIVAFTLIVAVLVAMIIAGPKSEPVMAAELRGVTPSRFNASIVMVTQTPVPTQVPSPVPTATARPSRLLTSGLAGESDLAGVSMTCSNQACNEMKSAFVWMCWSGKVVESAVRPFEFITLSNLPVCIKTARLDGKTPKNQSFGISSELWRSLAGGTPGFKMFVLDMYDIDYPPPYQELQAAIQPVTATIPKQ